MWLHGSSVSAQHFHKGWKHRNSLAVPGCPALQVQAELEEHREWQAAAQQLVAFTASALATTAAACGPSGSSAAAGASPRSRSPTKRAPLAQRSRNNSTHRLAHASSAWAGAENDENNSPAPGSPLSQRAGAGGAGPAPPSIAAAAAAALAASKADTPRAWLELLQTRFAAARDAAAAAERAALEADAALDAARKETSWHQQKVGWAVWGWGDMVLVSGKVQPAAG